MRVNILEFYSKTKTEMDECFPDMRPVRSAKRSSGKQCAPAFLFPPPPTPHPRSAWDRIRRWAELWPNEHRCSDSSCVFQHKSRHPGSCAIPPPRGPSAPGRHWSTGSNVNTEGMFWSNNGILSIESEKRSCGVGVDRLWWDLGGGCFTAKRFHYYFFFSSYNEHFSAK